MDMDEADDDPNGPLPPLVLPQRPLSCLARHLNQTKPEQQATTVNRVKTRRATNVDIVVVDALSSWSSIRRVGLVTRVSSSSLVSTLPLLAAATIVFLVEFVNVRFIRMFRFELAPRRFEIPELAADKISESISIRHSTRLTNSADRSLENILAVTLNL